MSKHILLPDGQLQVVMYAYAKFKYKCSMIVARSKEDFEIIRKAFKVRDPNPVDDDADTAVQTFFDGGEYITVVWYPEDRNLSHEELGKQLELAASSVYRLLKERKEIKDYPSLQAFCEQFVNVASESYGLNV